MMLSKVMSFKRIIRFICIAQRIVIFVGGGGCNWRLRHFGRAVSINKGKYCLFVCVFFVLRYSNNISVIYNGGQLTCSHCSWTDLVLLSGKPLLSAHTIANN